MPVPLLWFGIALTATVVALGLYSLGHRDRDPSNNQHTRMEVGIDALKTKMDRTNELLEQLIERFDEWGGH